MSLLAHPLSETSSTSPSSSVALAPSDVEVSSVEAFSKAASFEEIVLRYHGKIFQLVYRYTGDYEDACDLTQDTFVRAYGAWNEFRGDSELFTWLYRIAINACHNHHKRVQRRRQVEQVSLDAPLCKEAGERSEGLQIADGRPLPMQILESHELRVRLQEVLLELPDNYRTVIVLRDIEGLTYEEIMHVTGSTLQAIKSRLFRARNAVRYLMEPYVQGQLPEVALLDADPASINPAIPAKNVGSNKSHLQVRLYD